MANVIVLAILWVLRLLLPAKGRHRTPDPRGEICGWTHPIPVHVLARTVPLNGGDHELIRPYVLAWERERQRQEERRATLAAVVAGEPDPGYTYPGAHALRVPA